MKINLFFISVCLLFSCKKSETIPETLSRDKDYFPLQKGYWIEYEVDSIIHLDNDDRFLVDTSIESYHFFIREEVDSFFTDGMGEQAWYLSRYKRTADTLPWTYTSRWTAKLKSSSAEKVEENQRFIKLSFPFNLRIQWNGNAYNQLPEENYSYDDLYVPSSFNGFQFDSSVTVVQNDFSSTINTVYKIEKYAPRVGMIYKQTDSVRTATLPSSRIILNGYEYKARVTNFKQ